jgi:hypothetical protein
LDEPLYIFLAEKDNAIEFVNDDEDIPSLEEFDDDTKKKPKSIFYYIRS